MSIPATKVDVNGQVRGQATSGAIIASNGSGTTQTSIFLSREGAPLDQKRWEIIQGAVGEFTIRTINDAYSAAQPVFSVARGTGLTTGDVTISTAGTPRMSITSAGFVGINTTGPLSRLHVVGDVRAQSGQFLGEPISTPNASNAPAYSFTNDASLGMYRAGASVIGWAVGGNARMTMTNNDLILGSTALATTQFRLRPPIVPSGTGSLNVDYGIIWNPSNPGGAGSSGNAGLVAYRGFGTRLAIELYAAGDNQAALNFKAPQVINFEFTQASGRQVSIGWALPSGPIAVTGTVNPSSRLAVNGGMSVYLNDSTATLWNLIPDASNTLWFTTGANGTNTTTPNVRFTSSGLITANSVVTTGLSTGLVTGTAPAPAMGLSIQTPTANGYGGLWQMCNTSTGAAVGPARHKHFRLNPQGTLEILNSNYDTIIFTLDDVGNALIAGNFYAVGDITAFYSDQRLKTDITPLEDALDSVLKLNGVRYRNSELAANFGYTDTDSKVGVLAHEVQAVLPEAVTIAPFDRDTDGTSKSGEDYLTVKYEKLVQLLIEAIKELKGEVDALKEEIKQLRR